MKTDTDGKPGLRIESAASVTARDMITKHIGVFMHVIRGDRAAGPSTAAAYVDGLAGVVALMIAGRHGSQEEVTEVTILQLRDAIKRDLQHLRRGV
jgi:hypothetical protein